MVYHFYFESAERAYNLKLTDDSSKKLPIKVLLASQSTGVELLHIKRDNLKLVSYQNKKEDKKVYIESFAPKDNRLDIYLTDKKKDAELPEDSLFRFVEDGKYLDIWSQAQGYEETEDYTIAFHYRNNITGEIYINCIPGDKTYSMVLDFGSEASQMLVMRNGDNNDESELFNEFVSHFYDIDPDNISERTYDQQDDKDKKLFRSIYFLPKQKNELPSYNRAITIRPGSGDPLFNFITKRNNTEDKGQRLPNIKISYLSGETPDEIEPEILHQAIVMRFVHEAIMEVKDKRERKKQSGKCAIRMFFLVPNVMGQVQLSNFIRAIQEHTDSPEFRDLLPDSMKDVVLDIRSFSESDASFIYWSKFGGFAVEAGNYLMIDVGKGTTDFSIIKVEDGSDAVSIYRSGFVGAGNALNYAMFENYITSMSGSLDSKDIIKKVLTEAEDADLYRLERVLEDYKQDEDAVVNVEKKGLRIEKGMKAGKIIDMIGERGHIDDQRGIIRSMIYQIIEKIIVNVKETNFNKVVLGGRAFKYQPFRDETIDVLEKLYHLKDKIIFMDQPKRGCLRGPLLDMKINKQSDIIGIPIKVDVTKKENEEKKLKDMFMAILKEKNKSRDIVLNNHEEETLFDKAKAYWHNLWDWEISESTHQKGNTNRKSQTVNLDADRDDIVEMMCGEKEIGRCDSNIRFYISDDEYVPENNMKLDKRDYSIFFDGIDFYVRDERSSMKLKTTAESLKKGLLYESLFPYPYRILPESYDIPDIKLY